MRIVDFGYIQDRCWVPVSPDPNNTRKVLVRVHYGSSHRIVDPDTFDILGFVAANSDVIYPYTPGSFRLPPWQIETFKAAMQEFGDEK